IVSAGYANRWGFPKPAVRERWEASGAVVWVTGEQGAISVSLGAAREPAAPPRTAPPHSAALGGVAVHAERDGRHRYWQARAESAASAEISW
ncbi:MAG TPA: hypothetical protein VFO94_13930, partial [Gammaproteobacteria bacterium]|nr:hypothetical protein [Gammaproteobacteria bacterium]